MWSDSEGRLWVSEWNVGNLSVYDPASKSWTVHKLPGDGPHAYAVYVDDKGKVWVTISAPTPFSASIPRARRSSSSRVHKPDAVVRQLNGRTGEVWGAGFWHGSSGGDPRDRQRTQQLVQFNQSDHGHEAE